MIGGEHAVIDGMSADIDEIDQVIGQFLDFARVTGEKSIAAELDLNELVNSVVERYQRQGKTIGTQLSSVPRLQLKALAIQRLLTNLVDNALRHGSAEAQIVTGQSGGRAFV